MEWESNLQKNKVSRRILDVSSVGASLVCMLQLEYPQFQFVNEGNGYAVFVERSIQVWQNDCRKENIEGKRNSVPVSGLDRYGVYQWNASVRNS